jgi:parallel beta-helix repeat protein
MERCKRLTGDGAPAPLDCAELVAGVREQLRGLPEPGRPVFLPDASDGRVLRVSMLNGAESTPLSRPRELVFDEPLVLRSGTQYDFQGVLLRPVENLPFLFEFAGCEGVVLRNARMVLPGPICGGARLRDCRGVTLEGNTLENCFYGIVLRENNTGISLANNGIVNTVRSAIYIQGDNSCIEVVDNRIDTLNSSSNWAAGIVLSSVPVRNGEDLAQDFWPDYHWPIHSPIRECLRSPHRVVCERNIIQRSKSSGVYCDGAYECAIIGNIIRDCDKEGICLDNGTFRSCVEGNLVRGNGRRARQSELDLHFDFVLPSGAAPDGSSRAKLPGISLDNSLRNSVRGNVISGNYGGGVKMVRSGFLNRVEGNLIESNNVWSNDYWHFYGVSLDGMPADAENPDLDFHASHGNCIVGNLIANHYAGVYLGADSNHNAVHENTFQRHRWAIENHSKGRRNRFGSNFSRNPFLGTGLLSRARERAAGFVRRVILRRQPPPKPQPTENYLTYRAQVIIETVSHGNIEKGLLEGAALLAEFPDFTWFRGHYAHWLVAAGRKDLAFIEYERIVRAHPWDAEARRVLDELRRDESG